MKLLLDTHAFIWWDSDPAQLSALALAALRDPANESMAERCQCMGDGHQGPAREADPAAPARGHR
jgi:hypothetical protein